MTILNNLSKHALVVQKEILKHSPELLTGVGISGMVSAMVMAVKATPKALDRIEEAEYSKDESVGLTAIEKIKAAGTCYIPSAVMTGLSIGCIVGATIITNRRCASLATAYMLSEAARIEYKDKVLDVIGERKEKRVSEGIAIDKMQANPLKDTNEVIVTDKGHSLCYDSITGRYFYSDAEKIRQIILELNHRLLSEMYISVNEFYDELDLPHVILGDDLGWHVEHGLIEVTFASDIAANGEPCLIISYNQEPKYGYLERY